MYNLNTKSSLPGIKGFFNYVSGLTHSLTTANFA